MTVIAEKGGDIEVLQEAFQTCFALPRPKQNYGRKFGLGVLSLFKVPWQLTGMVVVSLEKIADGAKATPDVLTLQKREEREKYRPTKMPPSNLATGLMRGTKSMVGQVMSAVAGVVLEPIRGAKKKGIKGATQGIGKGILGLIFKPVAGTIDLVT